MCSLGQNPRGLSPVEHEDESVFSHVWSPDQVRQRGGGRVALLVSQSLKQLRPVVALDEDVHSQKDSCFLSGGSRYIDFYRRVLEFPLVLLGHGFDDLQSFGRLVLRDEPPRRLGDKP